MSTQTIILTYGLPGAGKSTVLTIADEYTIPTIVMGDIVRENAREHCREPLTSETLGEWAAAQREQHGKQVMAEYTRERIHEHDEPVIVVDGCRSEAELAVFTEKFTVITIRIDATFTDRLHRLQTRDRDGEGAFTPMDLHHRDARELSWGLGDLFRVDTPDYRVINNTSFETFQEHVRRIFADLTGEQSTD